MHATLKQLAHGDFAYYLYAWPRGPRIAKTRASSASEARSLMEAEKKRPSVVEAYREAVSNKTLRPGRRRLNHAHVQMLLRLDAAEALMKARQRAAAKSREFALASDWILERLAASDFTCELTGKRFEPRRTGDRNLHKNPWGLSIDRADSAGGCTPDNCRVICVAANLAMSDWGEQVFKEMAEAYCRMQRQALK